MLNESDCIIEKNTKLDNVLTLAGYGFFTYKLIFLSGIVVAIDAIEVLSVSYILPEATCDIDLNDQKKGWINASIFIGTTLGAFLCGCVADVSGRRITLIVSLLCNGLFNLISALARNYYALCVFRFLSGLGVGGIFPVLYTYTVEFLPPKHRGKLVSLVSSFWTVGGMLGAGLAWIVIPLDLEWTISRHDTLKSWNIYLCLCVLPALSCAFLLFFMPESPKYLLENSKFGMFKNVMRNILKQNNPKGDLTKFEGELSQFGNDKIHEKNDISKLEIFKNSSLMMVNQLYRLFSKHIIRSTLLMAMIYNSQAFGYYGMFMWFPELFKRVEANNGSICSSHTSSGTTVELCETPTSVYMQGFIVTATNMLGYLTAMLFIDIIGGITILSISLALTGLGALLIWFLTNAVQVHIFSYVFGALGSAVWGVLCVITLDVFPTTLRSSGSGFCVGIGRISSALSNIIFGYMLNVYCFLPFIAISCLYWLASVVACFLKTIQL